MQQNQPEAFAELIGCLSVEEKATLEKNFEKAHEQVLECKIKNIVKLLI